MRPLLDTKVMVDVALKQLGVVQHFHALAKLVILVRKRVEAVWTGSHDLFDLVLREHGDIPTSHVLEGEFVPCAQRWVTGACFLLT